MRQADPLQGWKLRGPQDRLMVQGMVLVQDPLVLMPRLPFAGRVVLPAGCSIFWDLAPTSGEYSTLKGCGWGINELSRWSTASVTETLAAVHVWTKSHPSPTQHLLSNGYEPGPVLTGGGLSLVEMSVSKGSLLPRVCPQLESGS